MQVVYQTEPARRPNLYRPRRGPLSGLFLRSRKGSAFTGISAPSVGSPRYWASVWYAAFSTLWWLFRRVSIMSKGRHIVGNGASVNSSVASSICTKNFVNCMSLDASRLPAQKNRVALRLRKRR